MALTERPARRLHTPDDSRLMGGRAVGRPLPAGKVIVVVVVALVTAMVLNSGAMLRAGEGMPPGVTRTLTLGVARPVDVVARALGLDLPRRGLDALFGNSALTTTGDDGLAGAAAHQTLPPLAPAPSGGPPTAGPQPSPPGGSAQSGGTSAPAASVPSVRPLRTPTRSIPLRVLVTGDSLSDFVADQMTSLSASEGVLRMTNVSRDGTGLTRPSFFDWALAARRDVAAKAPEAVVMILGGNDGWNLVHEGRLYGPNSDEWQLEYAKRVVVVMKELSQGGRRHVYWSGPPTAQDPRWNRIFSRQNDAIAQAASLVPGVTYVDLYRGTAVDGRYADYVTIDGATVRARQRDGIHWSAEGARQPAELILAAIRADAGLKS